MHSLLNFIFVDFLHTPLAFADVVKITPGLPGPLSPDGGGGILAFVQNAYLLALGVAGLLAVASIAYGAIQYTLSRGNPTQLADAWDRIVQAFVGVLLLVGAGTILSVVNPGLTSLELPELERPSDVQYSGLNLGLDFAEIQELGENGQNWQRAVSKSAKCTADTSNATLCGVDNMRRCAAWNPKEASAMCNIESRGRPAVPSGTDRCVNPYGNKQPVGFSMGLMQINLIAHNSKFPAGHPCKNLFTGSLGQPVQRNSAGVPILWSCQFKGDFGNYQKCQDEFRKDGGKLAIDMGCSIYGAQSSNRKWQPWPHTAAVVCGYKSKFGSSGKYQSHPELYP